MSRRTPIQTLDAVLTCPTSPHNVALSVFLMEQEGFGDYIYIYIIGVKVIYKRETKKRTKKSQAI
jgi:hypothetical protein